MKTNGPSLSRAKRLGLLVAALLAGASATALGFYDGRFAPVHVALAQDDDGPGDDGPVGPDDDGPVGPDDDFPGGDDGPAGNDDGPGRGDDGPDGRDDDNRDDGGAQGQPLGSDEALDDAGNIVRRAEVLAIAPSARSLEIARQLGFGVGNRIRLPTLGIEAVVLRAPKRLRTVEALRLLRSRDGGTVYDFNHLYDFRPTVSGQAVRPFEPKQRLRQALSQRNDIVIGLIDTEVDGRHPTLRGAWLKQRDFLPARRELPEHGTAVASLLLDQREGLVPRGRLFVASIFQNSVRGNAVGSVAELALALDWLAAEGVSVVNMSLAGPPNELLRAAVERTIARGHVIVAAVGNDGPNAKPLYPASYAGVLGITAIDGEGRIYRRAAQGQQVDFAAPGVDVPLAHPKGYGLYTGTSFAAPYATAVVAAGLKRPDPRETERWMGELNRRAIDLGPRGRDPIYGMGLISLEPPPR